MNAYRLNPKLHCTALCPQEILMYAATVTQSRLEEDYEMLGSLLPRCPTQNQFYESGSTHKVSKRDQMGALLEWSM